MISSMAMLSSDMPVWLGSGECRDEALCRDAGGNWIMMVFRDDLVVSAGAVDVRSAKLVRGERRRG